MKWLKGVSEGSFSRSFNKNDESDWVSKLKVAHDHAWKTWKRILPLEKYSQCPLQLLPGQVEMEPGKITAEFVAKMRPRIAAMPPKKKINDKV